MEAAGRNAERNLQLVDNPSLECAQQRSSDRRTCAESKRPARAGANRRGSPNGIPTLPAFTTRIRPITRSCAYDRRQPPERRVLQKLPGGGLQDKPHRNIEVRQTVEVFAWLGTRNHITADYYAVHFSLTSPGGQPRSRKIPVNIVDCSDPHDRGL